MGLIDTIRKKVGQPLPETVETVEEEKTLPEDLEPFKFPPPPMPTPQKPIESQNLPPTLPPPIRRPAEKSYIPPEYESLVSSPAGSAKSDLAGDRTELILQKLDTIDARLRFIEERLRR